MCTRKRDYVIEKRGGGGGGGGERVGGRGRERVIEGGEALYR